jgi:hypothetical protein
MVKENNCVKITFFKENMKTILKGKEFCNGILLKIENNKEK